MFHIMDLYQTCKRAFLLALAALFCAALLPLHAFAAEEADTTLFSIPVSTKLTGSPGDPAAFTIKIEPVGDAPAPVESTVTIKGAGSAEFQWTSASVTHTGRFEYVVSQQNDGTTYYTYDSATYTLHVTVKYDPALGHYGATYSAYKTTDGQTSTEKSAAMEFSNSYYRPSSGRPSTTTTTPTPDPDTDTPTTPGGPENPTETPEEPTVTPDTPETPAVTPETPAEEPQPETTITNTTTPTVTVRDVVNADTVQTATQAPQTGDNTNTQAWVAVICVCAIGAAGCGLYLGKKHREQ
jgi:pilin isopeptide linkage protein